MQDARIALIVCFGLVAACGSAPKPAPSAAAKDNDVSLASPAKMVVLPLRPVGQHIDANACELLTGMLLTELSRVSGLQALGTADIEAALGLERQKDALGCDSVACAADLGGALGAELVLYGHVGNIGSQYTININVIRASAEAVGARLSDNVAQTEDALVAAIPRMTAELVRRLNGSAEAAGATDAVASAPEPALPPLPEGLELGSGVTEYRGQTLSLFVLRVGKREANTFLLKYTGVDHDWNDKIMSAKKVPAGMGHDWRVDRNGAPYATLIERPSAVQAYLPGLRDPVYLYPVSTQSEAVTPEQLAREYLAQGGALTEVM